MADRETVGAFPYERLLAFVRGELSPTARKEVQQRLEAEARWRAHLDSIRHLDLERVAARQDGQDLEAFDPDRATSFCRRVAGTRGAVLRQLLVEGGERIEAQESLAWEMHVDGCVYCRRMMRLVQAEAVRKANGVPKGEELLREWLLSSYYREGLDQLTAMLCKNAAAGDPQA